MMRSCGIAAVCLALGAPAWSGDIAVRAGAQILDLSTESGLPVAWTVCEESCDRAQARRVTLIGPGSGSMVWVGARSGAAAEPRAIYSAQVTEWAHMVTVELTAQLSGEGFPLVQRYELDRRGHGLRLHITVPPRVSLQMETARAFWPEPLPGFGRAFTGVEAVQVGTEGEAVVGDAPGDVREQQVPAGEWLGIRSHFWAWMAQADARTDALIDVRAPDGPRVLWRFAPGPHVIRIYAGPVEWHRLRAVAPELTGMLFAALWEPLRWLCIGLLFGLDWLTAAVGNPALAIILLSLLVKIALWPLTRIAEGWQAEVNRIQSRLQPRLSAIRREFRGEEAHNRTLALYRDEGVHPLFTLKSLAGFAIQVPIFIAAFDMLADNFALAGVAFLWIGDLSQPDRWLELPVALPFFGAYLNLLPVLMTAVTIVAAKLQDDPSLTTDLARRQRRRLYAMAGAFFLLFYTFPAGMVLYWTANNLWHLLKIGLASAWRSRA